VDLADVAVAEGPLGAEEHVQGPGAGGWDGEAEGRVPGGAAPAGAVRLGPLPRPRVAGQRDDSVDLHLREQVHVLEILRRDQRQLQCPLRHGGEIGIDLCLCVQEDFDKLDGANDRPSYTAERERARLPGHFLDVISQMTCGTVCSMGPSVTGYD
jgi:hypothetical protein